MDDIALEDGSSSDDALTMKIGEAGLLPRDQA